MARTNSHNTDVSAGDIFGNTQFTDVNDTYPLLAHSKYTDTWPKAYNSITGQYLANKKTIEIPKSRRLAKNGRFVEINGASGNNLNNVNL